MATLTARPGTRFPAPDDRTAAAPAEYRGLTRDAVKLLVADGNRLRHVQFFDLPDQLTEHDLVVVNNSATVAAEIDGGWTGHGPVVVHVAGQLDDGSWVVELRTTPDAAQPVLTAGIGDSVEIGRLVLRLLQPYPDAGSSPTGQGNRLWRVSASADLAVHLAGNGRPIAYGYLQRRFPLRDYQNVFSTVPGSAEMPSAGRPFSEALITRLIAGGIGVVPITLHTGLSSQEAGEPPQAERFAVPAATARAVNATRRAGGRVVAVGTTATRALESAVDVATGGELTPRRGWTERVVTPDDPPRVVTGLITGWHNPDASHLLLVESIAGVELTQRAYDAALAGGYLWHEFGDSALLLPDRE